MTAEEQRTDELLRFADILTTASAAAHFLGEGQVVAEHLLHSIAILSGEMTLEDLGRAVSPLVRRNPPGMGGTASPVVRELAQRWFALLGSDTAAVLSPAQLAELVEEIRRLSASGEDAGVLPG